MNGISDEPYYPGTELSSRRASGFNEKDHMLNAGCRDTGHHGSHITILSSSIGPKENRAVCSIGGGITDLILQFAHDNLGVSQIYRSVAGHCDDNCIVAIRCRKVAGMECWHHIYRNRALPMRSNLADEKFEKNDEDRGDGRGIDSAVEFVAAIGRSQKPATKERHGQLTAHIH